MTEIDRIALPSKVKDLCGMVFGRLTVLKYLGIVKGHRSWWCECQCGKALIVRGSGLRLGNSLSCGCLRKDNANKANTTHNRSRSAEYRIWNGMIQRCGNANNPKYAIYGGRGVKVCERWRHSFQAFIDDVGRRPSKQHSIDRFPDKDGDYTPNNVRWATVGEQNRNLRRNKMIAYNGESMVLVDWAQRLGMPYQCLRSRLKLGWSVKDAFEKPPQSRRDGLTYDGKTLTLQGWANLLKVTRNVIRGRLDRGWDIARTLSTPGRDANS